MARRQAFWAATIIAPLWLIAGSRLAGAAPPQPVEKYAEIPAALSVRLSPDGARLAMITSQQGKDLLVVHDLAGDDKVVALGVFQARWVEWKSATRLIAGLYEPTGDLFFGQGGEAMATRMFALDVDGLRVVNIGEPAGGFLNELGSQVRIHPQIQDQLVSSLSADPQHVLQSVVDVMPLKGRNLAPSVWQVDIDTGGHKNVLGSRAFTWIYRTDQAGTLRLAKTVNGTEEEISVRDSADADWRGIHRGEANGDQAFNPLAFVPGAPALLYVIGSDAAGHTGLFVFDTIKGGFDHLVDGNVSANAHTLLRDDRLIGYTTSDGTMKYLDPAWQHDAEAIGRALPGKQIELVDRTADGKRVLAEAAAPHEPRAWWTLSRSASPTQLTSVVQTYPDIAAAGIAPVTRVVYTARDGLQIPAWLTLPQGKAQGRLPFVVLPHDGPQDCDGDNFDFVAQFLASRGYGVLQPEFRGSTCFGAAFEARGFQQWGRAMQDDITDGTRWLIDRQLADPARICIVGQGYGGYASLEGVEQEPALYRCAAAWAPITDLVRLRSDLRQKQPTTVALDRLGSDPDLLSAASPALHADRIRVPVLLVHGKTDFTVQVEHSKRMEAALKDKGKPVEAVYLDDSDHFMRRYEARLAWLRALEKFLAANLGTAPATL